jgi:hypothetical protein
MRRRVTSLRGKDELDETTEATQARASRGNESEGVDTARLHSMRRIDLSDPFGVRPAEPLSSLIGCPINAFATELHRSGDVICVLPAPQGPRYSS